MSQLIFLKVYLDGELKDAKQFVDEQIVIGQNTDLQISLSGKGISPLHAVIEERASGYYISDLNSDSGTYKNGDKVFDEKLETGDELKIGNYKIEFYIGAPKPKEKPNIKRPEALKLPTEPLKPIESISKQTHLSMPKTGVPKPPVAKQNHQLLVDQFKKSKGSIVQVSTVWGDRIISTHHFSGTQNVTIGADTTSDIVIPLLGVQSRKLTLLKLGVGIKVFIPQEMSGNYYKDEQQMSLADLNRNNRLVQSKSGYEIDLIQGEMLCLSLNNDEFSIYIRFVPDTAKPIMAPILDFTTSEVTAVILAGIITATFGLFMVFYSPANLEDKELLEEPLRKAVVKFNVVKKPVDLDKPKKIVKISVKSQKKKINKLKAKKSVTPNPKTGRAGELRKNKRQARTKQARTKQASAVVNKGGSTKLKKAKSANVKSKNRDVGKEGLLSVFGSKGAQKQLSKAYSGSGELQGLAASATGKTGRESLRIDDQLGGRLKNIGVGGKGTSTSGFSGIGTKGKGSGTFGYGTGGIGERGAIGINIEGANASFRGSIDREAIRKVIFKNRGLFKFCYEAALRKNSSIYGRLEIQWDIVEQGRVRKAFVKSNSTRDKQFGECVASRIRGLVFPEPPDNEIPRVVYPFVFTAK